ncbi:hypothetical protein C8J57DRAFT_1509207 [Mycena rebaudengoi]|nr:hypothetical protein C8J57DRAFT_1509207 [Mycena rebaudengoi]
MSDVRRGARAAGIFYPYAPYRLRRREESYPTDLGAAVSSADGGRAPMGTVELSSPSPQSSLVPHAADWSDSLLSNMVLNRETA